jgi:hypothetical protein
VQPAQVRADAEFEGPNRKDSLMRLPIVVIVAAVLSLALAVPAAAKGKPNPADFSFLATIDCGKGPIQVGSTDDLYAPLVDLRNGREYQPVAWSVMVGDFLFEDVLAGASLHRTLRCSYDDGVAKGTVRIKDPRLAIHRGGRGHHRHHQGGWDHR